MSALTARVKPQYGPSLVALLAPRWRVASRGARVWVTLVAIALVGVLLAAGLTLENVHYSHGGAAPFSFEYRGLYRTTPEPNGYVRVQSHYADGSLKYSYAVAPLSLPPYRGAVSGELPVYATSLVRELPHQYSGFALRGEGKAKVNATLIGYEIAFTAKIDGRETWVRKLLFMPSSAHPRAGELVTMMSAPDATSAVHGPLEVGESGILLRALKTFSFG